MAAQRRHARRRPAGDQGPGRADHRRGAGHDPRTARAPAFDAARYDQAVALFTEVALADDYAEFLTLPAYERMRTVAAPGLRAPLGSLYANSG